MAKLLVIEDDPIIRNEVVSWLQFEGHTLFSAVNGREGINLALQHMPDLVVSDIVMPEVDGYRVLLELRIQPSTALTPFIFISAKSERQDLRFAMELGADDYITKPFTRDELMRAIDRRLKRHASYISPQHGAEARVFGAQQASMRVLPHELKAPLVGLLGIGELLVMNAESLKARDIAQYGNVLTSSAHRLYHLIENFLLYASLASDLERHSQPQLAIPPLPADDAATLIRATAEHLAVTYNRSPDLSVDVSPRPIRVEIETLRKIMYELLDNAFKYSRPHESVRVTGHSTGNLYALRVIDRGRGIAPHNISRIGPYMQFERDTHRQSGLGLGLTIARRLVENARGELTVSSVYGQGTEVWVKLPQS